METGDQAAWVKETETVTLEPTLFQKLPGAHSHPPGNSRSCGPLLQPPLLAEPASYVSVTCHTPTPQRVTSDPLPTHPNTHRPLLGSRNLSLSCTHKVPSGDLSFALPLALERACTTPVGLLPRSQGTTSSPVASAGSSPPSLLPIAQASPPHHPAPETL